MKRVEVVRITIIVSTVMTVGICSCKNDVGVSGSFQYATPEPLITPYTVFYPTASPSTRNPSPIFSSSHTPAPITSPNQSATPSSLVPMPSSTPADYDDAQEPEIYDMDGEKDKFSLENRSRLPQYDYLRFFSASLATFSIIWSEYKASTPVQIEEGEYQSLTFSRSAYHYIGKTICVLAQGKNKIKKICAKVQELSAQYYYNLVDWEVIVTPSATVSE